VRLFFLSHRKGPKAWPWGLKTPFTVLIRDRVLDAKFTSPEKILCLGLGSPSNSRDARAQLAFLLRLCGDLNLVGAHVTLYDPIFTDEDTQLLGVRLGLNITSVPIGYALSAPTIVYMPHCDMTLYESFLRENWSNDRLSLVILIGNNLCDYTESNSSRKMSGNFPCILQLAPYLESKSLPISTSHSTAFNNISVQRVRTLDLPPKGSTFWDIEDNTISRQH